MMSAFMFPIYLAKNKIQKTQRAEKVQKEGTTESRKERPTVGPDRPVRGKANSR